MALTNKPVITAYKYVPSPIAPPKSAPLPVPDFAGFVQKNTGVKQEFTPKDEVIAKYGYTPGQMPGVNKDVQGVQGTSFNNRDETTKNEIRSSIAETAKPKAAKPKVPSMTRTDVIDAMVEKYPALQASIDSGEITQDDIFAAALEKHPQIKKANESGEIDNTARSQQEFEANYKPENNQTLATKIGAGIAGAAKGVGDVGAGIERLIDRWLGVNQEKSKQTQSKQDEVLFGEVKKIAPKRFEGGAEVGKTAAVMALTPSGAPIRSVGTLGRMAIGAGEGAIGAQIGAQVTEGRNANRRELATSSAFGSLARGIQGVGAKGGTLKQTEKLVMPKLTAREMAARGEQGLTKTNILGTVSAKASKSEQNMAKAVQTLLNPRKTVATNMNRVNVEIGNEANKLLGIVRKAKVAVPRSEVINRIDTMELPVEVVGDVQKSYKRAVEVFQKYLNKQDDTAYGLLSARKEFYQDKYVKKLLDGADKPLRDAIVAMGDEVNGVVGKYAGEGPVSTSLARQSMLYRLRENLSTKIEEEGSTALKRRVKRNPVKAKALGWGSLVLGGYAVGNKGNGLPSNISE